MGYTIGRMVGDTTPQEYIIEKVAFGSERTTAVDLSDSTVTFTMVDDSGEDPVMDGVSCSVDDEVDGKVIVPFDDTEISAGMYHAWFDVTTDDQVERYPKFPMSLWVFVVDVKNE
jgi:hypothetical protein